MAVEFNAGSIFGIVCMALCIPFFVLCSIVFYRRRDFQPIKARQPKLVMCLNLVFIVWTILLCVQRIVAQEYPCILVLWQGYLGGCCLFNLYLVRCWMMYLNFNRMETMSALNAKRAREKGSRSGKSRHNSRASMIGDRSDHDDDSTAGQSKTSSPAGKRGAKSKLRRCDTIEISMINKGVLIDGSMPPSPPPEKIRRRPTTNSKGVTTPIPPPTEGGAHVSKESMEQKIKQASKFASTRFLFQWGSLVTLILMVPAVYQTIASEELRNHRGDGCLALWGGAASVLGAYGGIYFCLFGAFGFILRKRVDAFFIKQELRIVAMAGVILLPPWFIFNNIDSLLEWNEHTFPISTLALIAGATTALIAGTVIPLYKSLSTGGAATKNVVSVKNLEELIKSQQGFEAFKEHLTSEWSLENLIFWKEVEDYRKAVRPLIACLKGGNVAATTSTQVEFFNSLHEIYIDKSGSMMVNLPSDISKQLESELNDIRQAMRPSNLNQMSLDDVRRTMNRALGIFDEAQASIFKLMATDSFFRFRQTENYRKLEAQAKENNVLVSLNVL